MKYLILISGIIAALLFLFSLYAFLYNTGLFKPLAIGFLGVTVCFSILMIITKMKIERELRRKNKYSNLI